MIDYKVETLREISENCGVSIDALLAARDDLAGLAERDVSYLVDGLRADGMKKVVVIRTW